MKKQIKLCIMLFLLGVLGLSACTKDRPADQSGSEYEETETDSSEITANEDYDQMMSLINKIKYDDTEDQVKEILGEPDELAGSGITYNYYYFGEYQVCIIYASDGMILEILNTTTNEKECIYP